MARFSILASLASLAVVASGPASAGGFALHERSAEAQGASFAGADSGGGDVTFAGFNPAALGNVGTAEIGVGLSLLVLDLDAKSANVFTMGDSRTGFTDPLLVPALALGYRVRPDLVLGLTVNSQLGLLTDYPNDATAWPAAPAALKSQLTSVTVTPLLAWQPTPMLTISAGPAIHYDDATLSRAIDLPGTLGSTAPAFPVGQLEGDTYGLGWQAGLLLRPRPGTTLGLSYTSGYRLDIKGKFQSPAGTFDARAKADLPGVLGVGLRQDLGDGLTLMADARYFTWGRFDKIAVTLPAGFPDATEITDYRDSIFLGIGIEADIGHGITLRGGMAYDESPVSDTTRSPRVPDADRYWISVGASYRWSRSVKLDLAYSLLLPKDATVPANGATIFAPVTYGGVIHILSAGASLAF